MAPTNRHRPVVLGVDASAPRSPAVLWAAEEAARRGAPLRMVHATLPMEVDIRGFAESDHHRALRDQGVEALAEASALVADHHPGLELSTHLVGDHPARALCRESEGAEMIVVGSRGLGRWDEVLSTYSVAVPVSARSLCPVAVVRVVPPPAAEGGPEVVVGSDGSADAGHAVDFAIDLAARHGAALRVVQSWRAPLLVPVDEEAVLAELGRSLRESLSGRAADFPDVPLRHEVRRGHPVETLVPAAEHALAVVVGRRGDGGFSGLRLGSVPHGMIHHAPCPLVTVPPPAARAASG
ncbi:universal stress protein [Kitasatospora sp. NPDC127111]|uniref:universal stress protein n=1 Tax=Kitasatospora sp. NPDC127111 TaxID=3345363 RepID=UPI003626B697